MGESPALRRVRDGLKNGLAQGRRTPAVPPPPARMSPAPPRAIKAEVSAPEEVETQRRAPRPRTSATTTTKPRTFGVKRANRRVLDLFLSPEAMVVLTEAATGRSKSGVVVDAIAATYEELAHRFPLTRGDGPFAGAASVSGDPQHRKRPADASRKRTVVSLSEQEAELISNLVAATSLSVAAYADEALLLWAAVRREN